MKLDVVNLTGDLINLQFTGLRMVTLRFKIGAAFPESLDAK